MTVHTSAPPVPSDARRPAPAQRADDRIDELMQIIQAYNRVTERLQQSHETLTGEVRRLQSELASANSALQRSRRLAALGEMAAGIAHEVRNPLASIQLYAGLLDQDLSDRPDQRRTAHKIGEAVRGLEAIVNDVLTFSRELSARPVEAPAADLLHRAAESLRPAIEGAGVEIKLCVAPDGLAFAYDADLMHRAVVNLIRNALQAMGEGGCLGLAAEREGAGARVTVRDSGPGIAEADIDRIFNPFFTTRSTGTGLGLAIVHRIVEAHGGAISVHNDPPDGGAVFTLNLPLKATVREGQEPQGRSGESRRNA